MNPRTNAAALKLARDAVLSHCMCGRLEERGECIIVYFPAGFLVDAAQMRFRAEAVSKTRAFELLLAVMEKYWKLG